jgi:glycosyltransferase involved in cell wall biosynthesis/tetratricopeptide (TPR) repeat protein
VILTDAPSASSLPIEIAGAADEVRTRSFALEDSRMTRAEGEGVLYWVAGENLLRGGAADVRRALYANSVVNTNVIVHLPYLDGAELLSVQPRLRFPDVKQGRLSSTLRIGGNCSPSPSARTAFEANDESWARLYVALLMESKRVGGSLDALKALWQQPGLDGNFSALILRNLILVLTRQEEFGKAEELLALAATAFPGYAEIPHLHAILWMQQKKMSRAMRFLESAMKMSAGDYVGGGGENSYRAMYLLGVICDAAEEQEKAAQYWVSAANEKPAYSPSVRALLKQRMPRNRAARLTQTLGELARRETVYLPDVVNFFLEHDLTEPARILTESTEIPVQARQDLYGQVAATVNRQNGRPHGSNEKPGIIFSGPFLNASGHARTNRALAASLLISEKLDVGLDSTVWTDLGRQSMSGEELLRNGLLLHPATTDLTIRHMWPPDFVRPRGGKLVCIVPWEHSAVPQGWVRDVERNVDELWVPSEFVRQAFVRGGVSRERIFFLTNGVDTNTFRPDGVKFRPPGTRGFSFLFTGGMIRRKGIDLLLRAYGDAFSPEDDVTLVVKDVGSRSFYANNTLIGQVMEFARRPSSPHTLVMTSDLDDASLAALYRGADAFVLPYRGEGFAMPLVEAMACDTAVISTAAGPVLEYCDREDAFLVSAEEVLVPDAPPPLGEFSGPWTWFEPNVSELACRMREVFANRDEAKRRGMRAGKKVRETLAWDKVLPMYHERIAALTGMDFAKANLA